MPTAAGPNPPDNRHLAVSSLSRNDSLKSERSDKRVSFNNDVGIKHIPRGASKQAVNHTSTLPNSKQKKPDEWSGCHPVKLQPNNLTAEELEQEAAHLVDIVDSINCEASPLPKKKLQQPHKDFTSRSLDRSQKRNNLNRNGQPINSNYNRITNPIIKHLKADVNRRDNRRRDLHSDSDSDRYRAQRHKSVPDLLSATQNGRVSNPSHFRNGIDNSINYSSVDNLLEEKTNNIIQAVNQSRGLHSSHHSADNLLDVEQNRSNLVGYKSLGNIPHYTDSDSTDLSNHYKRPKVNQLIHSLNSGQRGDYRNTTDHSSDRESSSPPRGVVAPSRKHLHNNNQPFKYTVSKPSDLFIEREKSPFRETDSDRMYAQVNKHGIRQRLSMDSDYSAKIIITEDKPRNSYEGDDEAYETFNVQNNSMKNTRYGDYGLNLSRDDFNSKNNSMNNNINMSSVAVQTDTVAKALNKERHKKGRAPQPPTENLYANYRPSRKDVGSELTSADLVRQINHGFGRFDRSPSPPPRKMFNPSNSRPHIPLLSDTSDSEPEYRRRSDPLAKIRNQVLMGERLQEEHDAEEWEEREMARYQQSKLQNSNANDMRPLTIDEVEALSVEFDQHGDRKLVLSNKAAEKRSASLQTSRHQTETRESYNDRSFSEERTRPTKPLREKSQTNRDNNNQMTLERNKKNNLEKEKAAKEKKALEIEKENENKSAKDTLKSKGKDKKGKDTLKEKKKKRIKIKFFYDPRPQDKNSEDPLKRFTEYKGNDHKDSPEKPKTQKAPRSKSYDSRSQSRERDHIEEVSVNPQYARDSSRERTLSRPERNPRKSGSGSTDRLLYGRNGSGNDPSSHDESSDDRRRVRSTDSYDRRNRYDTRTEYNTISRDERRSKLSYERDANYDRGGRQDKYNSSDEYDRDRPYRPSEKQNGYDPRYDEHNDYAGEEAMRRSTFLERRDAYERRDSNNVTRRDSFSPRKELSVDRVDSYNKRNSYTEDLNRKRNGYHHSVPSDESPTREEKYQSSPDEEEKQERVMRQRKKFLSALVSDGRAKSSNVPSSEVKKKDNKNSPSILRSQSSAQNQRDRFIHTDKLGHESDPPPPPSVTSTNNKPPGAAPSKMKQNKKIKKKKKKSSWPWAFLGLRGSKRKKGPPSSRGGSEVGSNLGSSSGVKRSTQVLNNSRPTSRASSHRSSVRPTRPSVRASKIRKDAGESSRVWSSKLHDQRETRHWESATLQRPSSTSRFRDREAANDSYNRPSSRQNRNTRRISEGSSGSSAGHRTGRTPSFKQRYFGDSDNDQVRPRKSGPGDYRSLPNRTVRTGTGKPGARIAGGGSAGSSLQSSESENDSHQGSRASHVSTGSNRSVYLHATAVADIPVQREESEKPGVQRQTRKVTRSFSLAAPWKPKNAREAQQYEYDNREGRHAAKPPRPPRKTSDNVGRSQTLTNKDSKLSGWLKKRKNKEGKGI